MLDWLIKKMWNLEDMIDISWIYNLILGKWEHCVKSKLKIEYNHLQTNSFQSACCFILHTIR